MADVEEASGVGDEAGDQTPTTTVGQRMRQAQRTMSQSVEGAVGRGVGNVKESAGKLKDRVSKPRMVDLKGTSGYDLLLDTDGRRSGLCVKSTPPLPLPLPLHLSRLSTDSITLDHIDIAIHSATAIIALPIHPLTHPSTPATRARDHVADPETLFTIDRETHVRIRRVTEGLTSSLQVLANEPSLGLYRMEEHVVGWTPLSLSLSFSLALSVRRVISHPSTPPCSLVPSSRVGTLHLVAPVIPPLYFSHYPSQPPLLFLSRPAFRLQYNTGGTRNHKQSLPHTHMHTQKHTHLLTQSPPSLFLFQCS